MCLFYLSTSLLKSVLSYQPSLWIFHTVWLIYKWCSAFFSALQQPLPKWVLRDASLPKRYLRFWVNHSQARNTERQKRRRNQMEWKLILKCSTLCIKKTLRQKSKESGCKFSWYRHSQAITHLFMENSDLFDTMVTQLRRVNGKKFGEKKKSLPWDQNVKM